MRRVSLLRLFAISSVTSIVVLLAIAVPAASAAVQNRISAAITNNGPVEIPNSIHPLAKLAKDLGPTPAETRLGMSLRFSMTGAQSAALDQLLADQQNPASPRYHQWLSPTEFGAQFGLSSADIAKVSAWLTAQGFTVTGVANSSTFVAFSGTVAQAQTAFATSIHNVSVNGEAHFANITNASVPGALAGVVGDITGLHNFRAKPHLRASVVKPDYTSSISGDHFLAPGDISIIYQVNPLLNASTPINGTGESIAVTGEVDINSADVVAFRSASGLSTTNLPTTVHANGVDPGPAQTCTNCFPNTSDLEESSLDVEWSGAMAPSASILFVNSECALPGTGCGIDSMTWAIDNNLAPIVTTSYGNCEASWGSTDLLADTTLFKEANAQGQTVLAAAGDYGSTDCDAGPSAAEGQTVDFPASSPYVTGMGGTMFTDGTATGATTYWSGTNGATGGSAITYIPEAVWNDESFDAFGGGGGGASAFFTKPAWQVGITPNDGSRDVPDLSLDASDSQDPYLFCVSDSCTNGFRNASSNLNVAGGTSFDSQIFGGLLALVEQKIGARIGNANPVIYALANNASYYSAGATITSNAGVVFNDITAGSNAMPCTAGTANCLNGGSTGFSAASGYDLATGWGSVNVSNLANAWTKVTALGTGSLGTNTSSTALVTSPACVVTVPGGPCNLSVTSGSPVILTATVTGAAGTPTGTVQFLANNVAQGSPVTVVALNSTTATATYQWTTSCAAFGQQSMSASYSGDTNYQGSRGPALVPGGSSQTSNGSFITAPVLVTVSGTCPDFSLTASSSPVTVAAGGTIPPVTVSVAPANGFTGTVVFTLATGSTTSGYTPIVNFSPGSVNVSSTSSQTTSVTLTGITADLKMPAIPGNGGLDRPWYAAVSGAAVACLLLLTLPRKRRLGGLLLVALSIALISGATGCGGSSSSTGTTTTTTTNVDVGTYTETVVGTYTSSSGQVTTHSTTITYIIN